MIDSDIFDRINALSEKSQLARAGERRERSQSGRRLTGWRRSG